MFEITIRFRNEEEAEEWSGMFEMELQKSGIDAHVIDGVEEV